MGPVRTARQDRTAEAYSRPDRARPPARRRNHRAIQNRCTRRVKQARAVCPYAEAGSRPVTDREWPRARPSRTVRQAMKAACTCGRRPTAPSPPFGSSRARARLCLPRRPWMSPSARWGGTTSPARSPSLRGAAGARARRARRASRPRPARGVVVAPDAQGDLARARGRVDDAAERYRAAALALHDARF